MTKEQPVFALPQAVCDPGTGFLKVPQENKKNPVGVHVGDTVVGFYYDRVTGKSWDTIYRLERMTKTLAVLKRSDGREVRLKKGKTSITHVEHWEREDFALVSPEDLEKAKAGQVTRDVLGQLSKDLVDSSLSFKARLERLDEARAKLSELIEDV